MRERERERERASEREREREEKRERERERERGWGLSHAAKKKFLTIRSSTGPGIKEGYRDLRRGSEVR